MVVLPAFVLGFVPRDNETSYRSSSEIIARGFPKSQDFGSLIRLGRATDALRRLPARRFIAGYFGPSGAQGASNLIPAILNPCRSLFAPPDIIGPTPRHGAF